MMSDAICNSNPLPQRERDREREGNSS